MWASLANLPLGSQSSFVRAFDAFGSKRSTSAGRSRLELVETSSWRAKLGMDGKRTAPATSPTILATERALKARQLEQRWSELPHQARDLPFQIVGADGKFVAVRDEPARDRGDQAGPALQALSECCQDAEGPKHPQPDLQVGNSSWRC